MSKVPATDEKKINRGNMDSNISFLEKTGLDFRDKRILEIGSGKGNMVKHLMALGADVIGLEINPEYVEYAKSELGIELLSMVGDKLEFPDGSFDYVMSFDVFEHIPDTDGHLEEVKRVLKPGGAYLFGTPNKLTNVPFEIVKEKSFTKYKSYHCSLFTYWGLRKKLTEHGLAAEFADIIMVTPYFREKVEKYLGRIGAIALRIVNPDAFPIGFRTNLYIVTSANTCSVKLAGRSHEVGSLQTRIQKAGELLAGEITSDVVLLDIANNYNAGDHFIYLGELAFMSRYSSHSIRYRCSLRFFNPKYIKPHHTILLHGGGNLGDLWPKCQRFKESIIERYPKNKIIILSSTVLFRDRANLERCVSLFSAHPNLVICSRDARSAAFLKEHFPMNKILLIPDMALFIPRGERVRTPNRETLCIKRNDRELMDFSIEQSGVTIGDWDRFEHLWWKWLHMIIQQINTCLDKVLTDPKYDTYGVVAVNNYKTVTDGGVSKICTYNRVISTRLHGFIISYLYRVPCLLIDNNYGKNSWFYDTWFRGEEDGYILAGPNEDVCEAIMRWLV